MRQMTAILCLCFAIGCESPPKGRVKSGDEGDLVGSKTAGAETYNALIEEATRKMLTAEAARFPEGEVRKIAFIGVENLGSEELGDIRESTAAIIETTIFKAGRYKMIDKDYVAHILQINGMVARDLFTQKGLDQFLSILRKEGQDPHYLLLAQYSTLSTEGEKERQRDYLLTLRMTDAASGDLVHLETARVRKAYRP